MPESPNLSLLQQMFPGQVVLNVDEIASLGIWGKRHIYNLSSAKKLPFKRLAVGDLKVTLVEMARYLDSQQTGASEVAEEPVKRKPGRPRGSRTEQLTVALFQSELKLALLKAAVVEVSHKAVEIGVDLDSSSEPGLRVTETKIKALMSQLLMVSGSLPRTDEVKLVQIKDGEAVLATDRSI